MALDKLIDSARLDGALSATATAILSKTGGSTPLTWDMDEVSRVRQKKYLVAEAAETVQKTSSSNIVQ